MVRQPKRKAPADTGAGLDDPGAAAAAEWDRLQAAADRESYNWLAEERPNYAEAVEGLAAAGAEPAAIRRFLVGLTGRRALALRCEQAARHCRRLLAE